MLLTGTLTKLFKRFEKEKEKEIVTLQKVAALFKTTEGLMVNSKSYKWANVDKLSCGIGRYLMCDITEQGYINGRNGKMYLLSNVIDIDWYVEEKKNVYIKNGVDTDYRVFYSDDEFEEVENEHNNAN